MSYTGRCENCGCYTYNGHCVNCDEEYFIQEQKGLNVMEEYEKEQIDNNTEDE